MECHRGVDAMAGPAAGIHLPGDTNARETGGPRPFATSPGSSPPPVAHLGAVVGPIRDARTRALAGRATAWAEAREAGRRFRRGTRFPGARVRSGRFYGRWPQ